jgi:trehalose 6-phosphate synthase/phosphatase
MLDYDGTLHGFVPSHKPEAAAPDRRLYRLIESLTRLPDTEVCIVSGRTREALDGWFGKLSVSLAAEHGAWIRQHGEWAQEDIPTGEYKAALLPLLERYAERTPGARVEEKNFALVWHYRGVPAELAYARNANLKHDLAAVLGNNSGLGVHNGNKIIEIKPHGISKGVVADEMLASTGADFVLCIGDDYTDEDMFRALPETAYTIKVGSGESHARFRLPGVESVHALLSSLNTTS